MSTVILVDSQFGNTARVAHAVAQGVGADASVIRVGDPSSRQDLLRELDTQELDVLVVGGPTINRGVSPLLGAILEEMESRVHGLAVATFDTRLRGPGLLLGSAAKQAGKLLHAAGADTILPPEGFYVRKASPAPGGHPRPEDVVLVAGELERARSWGARLRDAIDAAEVA